MNRKTEWYRSLHIDEILSCDLCDQHGHSLPSILIAAILHIGVKYRTHLDEWERDRWRR